MAGDFGSSGVNSVTIALFIAFFVKAGLDRVAAVLRARWPEVELGLPFGIAAMVLGGGLGWLANINALAALPLDPTLGRALTAVAVGLGVEFLNDVLAVVQGRRVDAVLAETAEPAARARALGWQPEGADTAGMPDAPDIVTFRVRRIGPPVRGW